MIITTFCLVLTVVSTKKQVPGVFMFGSGTEPILGSDSERRLDPLSQNAFSEKSLLSAFFIKYI